LRIGQGFDVHRFAEERRLVIGGVKIPYKLGLLGHSDADVLLHALADAILGALAKGDIGKLFPDNDPSIKGIDSKVILSSTWEYADEQGFKVENVDMTIIAQKPKMAPYIDRMRENIAGILGCEMTQVNIKATTTEQLGFTGREEGIAALATILISR